MAKKELILLALDNSDILKLMDSALRSVNYDTLIADDTKALSRLLQENTPSLLLVGESFRGYKGLDIIAELIERFPTLPVLVYVEKPKPEYVRKIFKSGITGYLAPPLRTDDIVDIVEGVLNHAHRVGDWVRREVRRTTSSLKKRAQISEGERARLEALFNNIKEGVVLLDEDRQVQYLNPAMCDLFGFDPKSVIGKKALDVFEHPDLHALVSGRTGSFDHQEISFADGRVASAQYLVVPDFGYALTIQDVTHLKEMDRIRNEVVNTVSHDLRSPLTSVVGYTELIMRSGSLNESQTEYLKQIQGSVEHITDLINDLLELGSIEAGLDTQRESVEFEALMTYTLDMLQGQIKAKHIQIEKDVSPSLPPLRANPIRLRQVLDNVIGNAIKYSEKNGEVKISAQAMEEQVIITVSDNGPGIPKYDQPHIFDKFYRGQNKGRQDGSGLGLAIVKSIVDAHQGRIWVESTEGIGTTFFIIMPVNTPVLQTAKTKVSAD